MLEITYQKVTDLIPYVNNSRTHSEEQVKQIAASIKEFGFTNPILIDENKGVIAGHGRLLAAGKLALAEVPTIVLEGLTEAQRKAYVIADNKLALNAGWDTDALTAEIERLKELDFDIALLGFDLDELDDFDLGLDDPEEENPYTDNVEGMHYEPTGVKPELDKVYNTEKQSELIKSIEKSKAPEEIKCFLRAASYRHVQFNYQLIAEYYAHCDSEIKSLFEQSALVIIDYDDALKNGYVKLSQKIAEQYQQDYPQ